jgi:hypothetical protein
LYFCASAVRFTASLYIGSISLKNTGFKNPLDLEKPTKHLKLLCMKKITTLFYDEKYQGVMVLATTLLLAVTITVAVLFV